MNTLVTTFYHRSRHRRRVRSLAAVGMGLAAAMPMVFFATGFERGGLYLALQLVAALATVAAAWGVLRGSMGVVAGGLAWNGLNRVLHSVLDLTRLAPALNWSLALAWLLAAGYAVAVALRPTDGRVAGLRLSLWLLAAAYFVATVTAVSGGRLPGMVGLLLGCVGISLVAPNLHAGGSSDSA